ncbi:MFS transporter [Streptomyces sp. NPDC021354]|uniref:MFS transporter n=1 Tax=Streptomyces sp. NPDC021354 TaxID=3154793 RepID=UPI0033CCF802
MSSTSPRVNRLALAALAACLFVVVTAEYVVVGLLPELSGDLRVSVPTAGLLVTGYALAVTVGGPVVTALTLRAPRKGALLGLLGVFTAGNLVAASAGGFGLLMAARVLTALTHSTFFAITVVTAAAMVPEERRGRAVAFVSTGLNLATVLGAPLGTWIGNAHGWRATFWALGAVSALAFVAVARLVPAVRPDSAPRLRDGLAALRARRAVALLAVTLVAETGFFVVYTYIAPILGDVAGFGEGAVTVLLVVFGGGALVGNLVGGRLADRRPQSALRALIGALAAALAGFAVAGHWAATAAVVVFGLGVVAFVLVPVLQTQAVAAAPDAPTLAVSAYTSVFNLAIAAGSWLGGRVLDSGGLGLTALAPVGALVVLAGLGLTADTVFTGRAAVRPGRSEGADSARQAL